MKEIDYEGPSFAEKESEWRKKQPRSFGSDKVPVVRTFRADVEGLIKEKGTTRTQIVMAETARRESRGEKRMLHDDDESHLGRIIFLLILVLAFGIGVGAYALLGAKISLPFFGNTGEGAATTTPVATTNSVRVVITGSPREQIVADVSIAFGKTSLPQGSTRSIDFQATTTGGARTATPQEFFAAIALEPLPSGLLRSLDTPLRYDIHSDLTLIGTVAIQSRSYPNTFAGMLEWEPKMAADVLPLLNPWYTRSNLSSVIGRAFHDERIGNIDARVLSDPLGTPLITYGFVGGKTLVIAGDRDSLLSEATLVSGGTTTTQTTLP